MQKPTQALISTNGCCERVAKMLIWTPLHPSARRECWRINDYWIRILQHILSTISHLLIIWFPFMIQSLSVKKQSCPDLLLGGSHPTKAPSVGLGRVQFRARSESSLLFDWETYSKAWYRPLWSLSFLLFISLFVAIVMLQWELNTSCP